MKHGFRSYAPLALVIFVAGSGATLLSAGCGAMGLSAGQVCRIGCGAMGMDRGPLEPPPPAGELVVDDSEVAEALARRPQLPTNARVGVYFTRPAQSDVSWRWSFEEREALIEASAALEGITLFPLTEGVDGDDLRQLRVAGARNGADAVLVVRGEPEQETHDNGWLATYPLILPIFFAPAQELSTRFNARAAMYDVRNGFLYLAAESEGFEAQQRAHVWIDRQGGVETAKEQAVEQLAEELRERLAHLIGERVDGEAPSAEPAPGAAPASSGSTEAEEPSSVATSGEAT